MKHNRSVPPATVVPVLGYPDVRAAVAWLTDTFGFVERTRIGEGHRAQLSIGDDGAVIIADAGHEQQPPHDGAVPHLVRVRVEDLAGHRWQFAESVRDVAPEEFGAQTVEPWPLPSNT